MVCEIICFSCIDAEYEAFDGMEFYYSAPGHEARRGSATLTPVNSDPNIWQSEKDFIVDGQTSLKMSATGANKQWVRYFLIYTCSFINLTSLKI